MRAAGWFSRLIFEQKKIQNTHRRTSGARAREDRVRTRRGKAECDEWVKRTKKELATLRTGGFREELKA